MGIGKIFKVFKKASKAVPKKKGGKGEEGKPAWPPGIKVGLFGHDNSGKTVYYTVLNEECKISKELQISVTDNATANEFLMNYRALWGLGMAQSSGTMVDLKGEKKFPKPTDSGKILQFTAILDQSKKLPIVAYDYDGKAVSISEASELSAKVFEYMSACDGILFFFDPKVLAAELQTQAHVASYVNMLERLAPLSSRLPIPIGLVITKADVLPGFTGENQTVLISANEEQFVSQEYDQFLEKILSANRILSNSTWAGTIRNIMVRLREFLRIVIGRTLDFQVFFVSNTGDKPEKIGTDVGRSIYAPPQKMRPSGVREPFYWLLKSIVRSRRISKFRKLAKYVAVLSLIWIVLFSLPFLLHFKYFLPRAASVEENILKNYNGNALNTSSAERDRIKRAYAGYEGKWLIRNFFPNFLIPAGKIKSAYMHFDEGKAVTKLDGLIMEFAGMLSDSARWPGVNPSNDSLVLSESHKELIAELNRLKGQDESSILYVRAGRVLNYWNLLTKYIVSRKDTVVSAQIAEQVNFDQSGGREIDNAEKQLGAALIKVAKAREKVVAVRADSKAALEEFETLKDRINENDDPAFRFKTAVRELEKIKGKLNPATDGSQIAMINRYLDEVKEWSKRQKFTYKIESVPDNGHLHIEVTKDGANPTWSVETQLFEGDEVQLEWKLGDDIYIAFDDLKFECQWGKVSSDRIALNKGQYTLFEMEGNLTFENIGKTITISFKPSLKEKLPKME